MPNERGQYGNGPRFPVSFYVGAEPTPSGRSAVPWILGGAAVIAGLALVGGYAARKEGPQRTAHEKEVRAWEAEFPGLPWYQDQVRSAEQLDSWERARDYWERTH
ncbi:MAG TPA: hypothetical protein VLE97_11070 [Gaiellaceae bacterium]|nr:hypothetical protein [Gaiellaceae bacterium]